MATGRQPWRKGETRKLITGLYAEGVQIFKLTGVGPVAESEFREAFKNITYFYTNEQQKQ